MRVLVTGGGGSIGSHVVRQLSGRGHTSVVFDPRMRPSLGGANLIHVPGDIRDLALLVGTIREHSVEAIAHLAAVIGPWHNAHPSLMYEVNLNGSMNVLEAARLTNLRRMVLVSSWSVYAAVSDTRHGPPEHLPVPEEWHAQPGRLYSTFKFATERLSDFYSQAFGLEVTSLRFSSYYGPERALWEARDSPSDVLNHMLRDVLQGKPVSVMGRNDGGSDLIYVKDCAHGVVAALEAPRISSVYNIGSGRLTTQGEVIEALSLALPEARVQVVHDSGSDATKQHQLVLSIEKAERELGYRPQFDIFTGIADCIAEMRELVAWSRLAGNQSPREPRGPVKNPKR